MAVSITRPCRRVRVRCPGRDENGVGRSASPACRNTFLSRPNSLPRCKLLHSRGSAVRDRRLRNQDTANSWSREFLTQLILPRDHPLLRSECRNGGVRRPRSTSTSIRGAEMIGHQWPKTHPINFPAPRGFIGLWGLLGACPGWPSWPLRVPAVGLWGRGGRILGVWKRGPRGPCRFLGRELAGGDLLCCPNRRWYAGGWREAHSLGMDS
jgi:hypothetical protein